MRRGRRRAAAGRTWRARAAKKGILWSCCCCPASCLKSRRPVTRRRRCRWRSAAATGPRRPAAAAARGPTASRRAACGRATCCRSSAGSPQISLRSWRPRFLPTAASRQVRGMEGALAWVWAAHAWGFGSPSLPALADLCCLLPGARARRFASVRDPSSPPSPPCCAWRSGRPQGPHLCLHPLR